MSKQLVIIGAGPKAMAIASKSAVLRELGFEVPVIHIVERCTVGANWTGKAGYTNGKLALGTSPEKDVGFPYRSTSYGDRFNREIDKRMTRFSWQSFLVEKNEYAAWVDRGRPAPEHAEWASYLQWVAASVKEGMVLHQGEVVKLAMENDQWKVGYRTRDGETRFVTGDGLVVTGPGKIRLSSEIPIHDRVFTVESFWKQNRLFQEAAGKRVALVGSGENAASIAMSLVEANRDLQVDIISPSGMSFSRGESYLENRVYSNPEHMRWEELTEEDKRNFIKRTDRGVFSLYAKSVLDRAKNLDVVAGRLVALTPNADGGLKLRLSYGQKTTDRDYDFVVIATGADQLSFLRDVLEPGLEGRLTQTAGLETLEERSVERSIDPSLALKGMTPRLHLPMLSGINQGPGFANLSSLGLLSDRILTPYLGA